MKKLARKSAKKTSSKKALAKKKVTKKVTKRKVSKKNPSPRRGGTIKDLHERQLQYLMKVLMLKDAEFDNELKSFDTDQLERLIKLSNNIPSNDYYNSYYKKRIKQMQNEFNSRED
jgi:Asp-tRNA(Asn)/Glu-tRNA(Gln) amidotransferase A subunit family amidase